MTAATDRFWANVQKTEECWLWTGTTSPGGYGRFSMDGRRHQAHRIAYEWAIGPIPEGLVLDHLCRNRACVNPEHLEPVTQRVNILRGVGLSAIAARATHCPKRHPYSPENTHITPSGFRRCRTCHRQRAVGVASRAVPWTCALCGKTVRTSSARRHELLVHPELSTQEADHA